MIKVLLVEDEPSAMRHLRMVIEQKCSGFEIAGTAENGEEGLEKTRILKPDILITDVKMPVMDGIKLVSRVKEELPHIYSIIISGYQDFEYAKGALKSGVVDYLLKPVNPAQLSELLGAIKWKLDEQYRLERMILLKNIIAGNPIEQERAQRALPFHGYMLAILRKNGLPSRFLTKQFSVGSAPYSDILPLFETAADERTWAVSGRDEMEAVFIHTPELPGEHPFETIVSNAAESFKGGYYNIAFSSGLVSLQEIKKYVTSMYRILDNNTVIGMNQIFRGNRSVPEKGNPGGIDTALWNRLNFYLANGQAKELKQEIVRLFSGWEEEKRTQLWVENILRQVLHYVNKYSINQSVQIQDLEYLLDESLYYSSSFGELMANIWDIIEKLIGKTENKNQKVDNPEFFSQIEQYIENNLSEPLTLQSVCLTFGLSQTYLSRLFRKYKNMSFNEYLTTYRVSTAKRIITEHPEMHLKDVAEAVGYNDQFYFSRVFRSITGTPPSEFLSGRRNNE
jgi:YesN/AraC family two-component response regulator